MIPNKQKLQCSKLYQRNENCYGFTLFVCTYLDESSAALLEETKHPAQNRHNGGCHDDDTKINPNSLSSSSVGEVYDKVNEEYIKRMKDLEKSIEEASQQKIMVERQTMLQEYWKRVQVSGQTNFFK